jgi:hypothetical protein
MNMNQKVTFSDTVYAQEIDDEMVLLDMTSENYFGLDTVGRDIWQLLQEGKTLQEAQDALLEMYDVDLEILKKDFLDFVGELKRRGLLQTG